MPWVRTSNVRILKHHRTSDIYLSGRYLHVSMKISLRSKRGRDIARETAETILLALANNAQLQEAIEADDPL
jgi:hypothetical protein